MKKLLMIIPLVILLCFAFSCQDKETKAKLEEMKSQADIEVQNKAIVRQLYEAIDRQDFDAFLEFCALEGMCNIAGIPDALPIKVGAQFIQIFYKAFPDSTHTINDIIAEGDKVAVRFILHGTHNGEYNAIAL